MTGRVIDIKTKQVVENGAPEKFPALFSGVTEYERGWGNRPDGFLVAKDLDTFNARVAQIHACGDADEFSRVNGEARPCYVTKEMHERLIKEGSVWTGNKTDWHVK